MPHLHWLEPFTPILWFALKLGLAWFWYRAAHDPAKKHWAPRVGGYTRRDLWNYVWNFWKMCAVISLVMAFAMGDPSEDDPDPEPVTDQNRYNRGVQTFLVTAGLGAAGICAAYQEVLAEQEAAQQRLDEAGYRLRETVRRLGVQLLTCGRHDDEHASL